MKKTVALLRRVLAETFWIALTGAVVFGGYQGYQYLKDKRAEVVAAPTARAVSVVETRAAEAWGGPLPVRGEGFVTPLRLVSLSALSGGKISYLHPVIVEEKGQFRAGDVLARLDDSAERANLQQTEANIDAAQTQRALERTRLDRVQALFDRGATTQQALDEAEARFADAKARLDGLLAAKEVIEVALDTKLVRAPFDGAVLSKSVELGSIVGSGEEIAEVYSDDQMVVDVNLSEREAALIPGLFEGAPARAKVRLDFAGNRYVAEAKVIRVAPRIDPRTRTLTATVQLDTATGLQLEEGRAVPAGAPPAMVNAFAQVEIDGIVGDDIYRVPSTALHTAEVWLLVDGQLQIAPARGLHVDGEETFVALADIPGDARIITSTIAAPVAGMALRDLASNDGPVSQAALAAGE